MKKNTPTIKRYSNKKDTQIRIRDFINLIHIWEKIFQNPLSMNLRMASFLKDMRLILNNCKELSDDDFLNILKSSVSSHPKKQKGMKTILPDNIDNMSFEELRNLLSKDSLSKEQLLIFGENRFGIPIGSHKKLKKAEIRKIIENSLDNDEKLNIIEKKASQ